MLKDIFVKVNPKEKNTEKEGRFGIVKSDCSKRGQEVIREEER